MRLLLSLSLLALAFIANARQITPDEALVAAQDFFNNSTIEKSCTPRAVRAYGLNSAQAEENAPYYIFNASDNNGFVIISGDTQAPKILAYSLDSNVDMQNIPIQLKALFENFSNRISNASTNYVHPSWEKSQSSTNSKPVVKPMLENVKWHQGSPYNDLCPRLNNEQTVVGCTGTALAMILYYHKWPEQSHGNITYIWDGPNGFSETISYDYGQKPYKWDKMLNSYDGNEDDEARVAVAELCRDCAYAASSQFGNFETGGSTFDEYINLINHFYYDTAIKFTTYHSYNYTDYCNILKLELDEKRPVLYGSSITPGGPGAHEFVCDGYDSDNNFHFNFGWSGYCNGYYNIESMGLFGEDQNFYYGIKKYEQDIDALSLCCGTDFKWVGGKEVKCELYHLSGWRSHMMNIGYAVENISTHEVDYYITNTIDWKESEIQFYMIIDKTPSEDGEYVIYPVARFIDGDWIKYPFSNLRQSYICLLIKNGKVKLYNPVIDYPIENGKIEVDNMYYILDDDNKTATVTYKNRRYESYKGNIQIPETITYEGQKYVVNRVGTKAFYRCPEVTDISIPKTIEILESEAFNCEGNRTVNISIASDSQLKEIGHAAFYGLSPTKVFLPNTLEIIGSEAFAYHKMSKIVIPRSVIQLGNKCFTTWGQTSKEDIYVEWTTQPEIAWLNWYAFDETYTNPAYKPYRTLYVPRGCKSMYEAVVPSDMIDKIEEYDTTGMSDIEVDKLNQIITVYNLHGEILYNGKLSNMPTLPSGIYLKRIGNSVSKVII